MRKAIHFVVAIVLVVCSNTLVWSGFEGQEITAQWVYPEIGQIIETHDLIVGPAIELPADVIENDHKIQIDIGDDYVLFTFLEDGHWQNTSANGWEFIDKNGTVDKIIGFEIGMVTGDITGLDSEDLIFTDDSIFANFGASGPNDSVDYGANSTIRLDILFIPEPATLLLLGLGGLLIRKRHK